MRLSYALFLVVNLSLGLACAQASGPNTKAGSPVNRAAAKVDETAPFDGQLEALFELSGSDQTQARQRLERLLADPRLATQPASVRHDAYALETWLALQAEDYPRALASAQRRVAADPNVMEDWYPLAMLEQHNGNNDAAAQALSHLIRTWPDQSHKIEVGVVSPLVYQFKLQPAVRFELLRTLVDAKWLQGRSANSSLWYELALMQLLDGQIEKARESALQVSSPEFIINLRSDKQFDPLIDRNSPQFDVGLAAREEIDTLQQLASAAPDSLELRNELTDAMLRSGQSQVALMHADLILAKIAQMSAEDSQFIDMDDKIWTMNNRAVALRRLGRTEEAIQQLETASRLEEDGYPNVSQILNLAQSYCSMGQPQKARETLARLGNSLSPYGKMVKASSEHRVAVQTQDSVAAQKALDYLRENRSVSESLYLWALLETSRLDQAAEFMKGLLASAADRTEALGWAQQSLKAPQQPGDAVANANLQKVLARSDVQTAIAAVGYVESYPVFTGYMTD